MSFGKEIFRPKYKETMDSLNTIKDNYYALDQEYQWSSKDKDKEIERLNNIIKEVRNWANKTVFYFDFEEEITKHAFDLLYTKQGQELLEILDKGE